MFEFSLLVGINVFRFRKWEVEFCFVGLMIYEGIVSWEWIRREEEGRKISLWDFIYSYKSSNMYFNERLDFKLYFFS